MDQHSKNNQVFAELNGICWHEMDELKPYRGLFHCSCGKLFGNKISIDSHIKLENSAFAALQLETVIIAAKDKKEKKVDRYYNGPKSDLMDELYDRLTKYGDPSEYSDWSILSLYIAREIKQIGINHLAVLAKKDEQIADLKKVHEDHHRLVRELDVLINREAGAAKQASLCDLVSQLNTLFPNHSIVDTCRYFVEQITALKDELRKHCACEFEDGKCISPCKLHNQVNKENQRQAEEIKRLKRGLEILIAFVPDGWTMPLGYSQVVAQIQKEEEPDDE